MFARTEVQSRVWRLFAIAAVVLTMPIALRAGSTTEWLRSAVAALALLGLTGYAFGFRVGPQLFWRAFSVLFALGVIWWLGQQSSPALHGIPSEELRNAQKPTALALGFAFFGALCLALFRYSGWMAGQPQHANSKPQPLFPPRADQRRHLNEATAAAQAKWEQPLPPAMKAEASSFGPHRQLSFEQHQRIAAIMIFGTLAAQLAVALIVGTDLVLLPTIALVIGSATATYFSAETILKRQSLLTLSWKATGILAALAAGSFFPDFLPVKLWFVSVIFADITALVLGDLLVVSIYASRRRA